MCVQSDIDRLLKKKLGEDSACHKSVISKLKISIKILHSTQNGTHTFTRVRYLHASHLSTSSPLTVAHAVICSYV